MRDTPDESARLATARFVAEHWRKAMVEWGKPGDAHPLCMVLAALAGATDPAECGIDADQHDEFRRVVSGGSSTPAEDAGAHDATSDEVGKP